MARLRFSEAALRLGQDHYEAVFRRGARETPPGYTFNTLITEWMTVNCAGDWASSSLSGRGVVVRLFAKADFERARARFTPNTPRRSAGGRALAGFQY